MKRYLYYLLFLIILLLVQTSSLKVFRGEMYFVPQLLLVFLIVHAAYFSRSFSETLWLGFAAGFFMEFFSGLFFGSYIVATVFTTATIYMVTRKFTSRQAKPVLIIFLVTLATLLLSLTGYLFNELISTLGLGEPAFFKNFFSTEIIFTVLVNLIFFYPILLITRILPPRQS